MSITLAVQARKARIETKFEKKIHKTRVRFANKRVAKTAKISQQIAVVERNVAEADDRLNKLADTNAPEALVDASLKLNTVVTKQGEQRIKDLKAKRDRIVTESVSKEEVKVEKLTNRRNAKIEKLVSRPDFQTRVGMTAGRIAGGVASAVAVGGFVYLIATMPEVALLAAIGVLVITVVASSVTEATV